MSIKSDFLGKAYSGSDFLLDSLNLVAADTRRGLDAPTAKAVSAMTDYVNANPNGSNVQAFNEYVAKINPATSEAKSAPVARAASKPGSGM
ncbi:MAG: hypothetical protein PW788_02655 [Micavibrio sp.]|nr:hypothetical protein [Micavibrio sp.]